MHVTKSSNVSYPEIIHNSKLHKYVNKNLFVSVYSVFKSVKPSLGLKEGVEYEPKVAPVAGMSFKAAAYSAALQNLGIAQNTPAQISYFETELCPSGMFNSNLSSCKLNSRFGISMDITS